MHPIIEAIFGCRSLGLRILFLRGDSWSMREPIAKDAGFFLTGLPRYPTNEPHSMQSMSMLSAASRCVVVYACILLLLSLGCDRTSEMVHQGQGADGAPSGERFVGTTTTPRSVLNESINAYRRLESYQDQGEVQLRYKVDGQQHVDVAPMSVAWTNKGELGMQVYSLRAGPATRPEQFSRWYLRLGKPDAVGASQTTLQNQVLSRGLNKKVTFEWLLNDRVVVDHISAGLAGFPPQLDLLCAEQPMRALLDESAELSFKPQVSLNGRACYIISLKRKQLEYRLWIDQANMLVRRIELPLQNLPAFMQRDQSLSDISLSVEFQELKANAGVNWDDFRVPVSSSDVLVKNFVQPPRVAPPGATAQEVASKRIAAFQLEGPSGDIVYQSTAAAGKTKVLVWLANHSASQLAVEQLAAAKEAISKAGLKDRVEFISIWAEPAPPAGMSFADLTRRWNMPGALAVDRQAMGRDLFHVMEAPTIVILDANDQVQFRSVDVDDSLAALLPQVISQVAQGADFNRSDQRLAQLLADRYEAELQLARAIDDPSMNRESIEGLGISNQASSKGYPPLAFRMQEIRRTSLESPVVAAAVDEKGYVWQLDNGGLLTCKQQTQDEPAEYQTTWSTASDSPLDVSRRTWLLPSPAALSEASSFVAAIDTRSGIIGILDVANQTDIEHRLPAGENIVAARWVVLGESVLPRLLLLTSTNQTLLLDARNREQLRGTSNIPPVAIIQLNNSSKVAKSVLARVALADGTLEPLQLPPESTAGGKLTKLVSSSSEKVGQSKQKLGFRPARGNWNTIRVTGEQAAMLAQKSGSNPVASSYTLARGWIADHEPAAFLLDENLRPLWRLPLPIGRADEHAEISSAIDPRSGQPVWLQLIAGAIHVSRADGTQGDHLRLEKQTLTAVLFSRGDQLLLEVTHPDEAVIYELSW